jgi:nicotinamidase-related amidase
MPRDEPTVATPAPGNDYAAQFNPGFALDPARVALVVVDMQYASGSRKEGLGRLLAEPGNEAQGAYRFDRIERDVVPTICRLLEFFRARSLRVIYLTVGSELPDYSDLLPHCTAWPRSSAIRRAAASTRSSMSSGRAPARPSSTRRP